MTATSMPPAEAEPGPPAEAGRVRARVERFAAASVGPALIVLAVLVAMHGFVLHDRLTVEHGDILEQWLPFYCSQGRALAAGHLAAFQPAAMGGAPFAGDPQTGWMYLPAMVLFAALPCGAAMRWFIVLQPILAGLGAYAFLRGEGVRRAAATAGGLVLALLLADSYLGLELPFAGALAWTALALAAASRLLGADRWSPRALWLLATAAAWGQIAAAHLSDGLVVGTLALVVYVAVRLGTDVRAGRRTRGQAAAVGVLGVAALPLVNLAFLLPRLAYLHRTTWGLGYAGLQALSDQLAGHPIGGHAVHHGLLEGGAWVLGLAGSPGSYLGAAACALAFAGPWSRRHRAVALALLAFGAVCWLAALSSVADVVGRHLGGIPFVGFYTHAPARLRIGAVLALPLAIGFGVDAWLDARTLRDRLAMLLPGLALWWVLPAAVGLGHAFPPLFLLGTAGASVALGLTSWRPAFAWAIPVILAVELVANGVIGARATAATPTAAPWIPIRRPTVDAAAYLREGAIARTIAASGVGRYATLAPGGLDKGGRHDLLSVSGWPALADQRSMLFGLEDAGGYNPTQELRYWRFVRMVDHRNLNYNSAYLTAPPPPLAVDLLQVRWLIAPAHAPPPAPGATPVVREGGWELFELREAPRRASVVAAWEVVDSPDQAFREISRTGFDPSTLAVLEGRPGLPAPAAGGAGTATYVPDGPQAANVSVEASAPAMVLVRNVFDPGWRATLDGAPVPILPADALDQAVAVPSGRHTIRLTYTDPSIRAGLAGSAASTVVVLAAWAWLRRRERVREGAREDPTGRPAEPPPPAG